ncbi:hypothetical protein I4U23_024479 [Adineta vaga]|nr:hypothetical protein I4U23_024479 [Adineta vaga]
MLSGSIASLVHILFSLLIRVLSEGFHIQQASGNIAWCKIRNYIATCASLTALFCFIWTGIDRFFSTCRQIKWRHLNSIAFAKQICLLTVISWMIFNIPILVYVKPSSKTGICISSSMIWSKTSSYILNVFCFGIFPWFLTSIFGILTLKNIRRIHQQRINPLPSLIATRSSRLDQQLTSMLFAQIIISIISSVPYCIQTIYDLITETIIKDDYRQAQENLYLQIVRLAFDLNYVSMFYVNYTSSVVFRRLSKKVLVNLFNTKDDISREVTVLNHPKSTTQDKRDKMKMFTTNVHNAISYV